jgi:hypothetical protein
MYQGFLYSSPPLIRPLLLQWKSGLIRGVASLEWNYLLVFSYLSASKSGLIRGVSFGRSGLIRGGLLYCIFVGQYFPWKLQSCLGNFILDIHIYKVSNMSDNYLCIFLVTRKTTAKYYYSIIHSKYFLLQNCQGSVILCQ